MILKKILFLFTNNTIILQSIHTIQTNIKKRDKMKKSLIIAATSLLFFVACTEDKKETQEQTAPKQEVVQNVEEKVELKVEETKTQEIKAEEPKIEPKAEEKKVEEKVEPKVEEAKTEESPTASNSIDAETLYKTCASCHGQKGEKEALGKSQVITAWDKDRVIKALNGYKDGSYGGVMKGIMKPHVDTKTPEEIDALATYISQM